VADRSGEVIIVDGLSHVDVFHVQFRLWQCEVPPDVWRSHDRAFVALEHAHSKKAAYRDALGVPDALIEWFDIRGREQRAPDESCFQDVQALAAHSRA
jgi:hypothetical protein